MNKYKKYKEGFVMPAKVLLYVSTALFTLHGQAWAQAVPLSLIHI